MIVILIVIVILGTTMQYCVPPICTEQGLLHKRWSFPPTTGTGRYL